MNEPVKIVFKYKNNHQKIQYLVYIFIGYMVEKNIMVILDKIKSMNFYDTLMTLSKKELSALEKYYSINWYTYFFLTEHIEHSKGQIAKNKAKKQAIVDKYSEAYYKEHFEDYISKNVKSNYSFASMIEQKHSKSKHVQLDSNKVDDYRIKSNKQLIQLTQVGLGKSKANITENKIDSDETSLVEDDVDTDETSLVDDDYEDTEEADDTEDIALDINMDNEDIVEDETAIDVDTMQRVIETTHVDNQLDEVQKLINTTIKDKGREKTIEFDTSNDEHQFEENINNIFHKQYVTNNYIDKEDTISTIRRKICMSIPNNAKFAQGEETVHILPNHQYLWSQYRYRDGIGTNQYKKDKIMLGQVWIKKSELLLIEIEPDDNLYMYEQLKSSLSYLKENMKRYSSKIRLDKNDENKCLYDYAPYMQNNEIFMVDIYNELGKNYSPTNEQLDNVFSVYVKIYYPNITYEELGEIVAYLNNKVDNKLTHVNKIKNLTQQITQDLIVENEIAKTVEETKKQNIDKYFKFENYIIQSTTHINLIVSDLSLYHIMDNYILSDEYPFIQYIDNQHSIVKVYNKSHTYIREKISPKFFESEQSGLHFRIITGPNKHIHIKLTNKGRIEYKTSMKEEDKITINDIKLTQIYVNNLIAKLNKENIHQQIPPPNDNDFNFAYINTIQRFTLPGTHMIKHNDLSNFVRYFYPYITIVIDPKKRESKDKQSLVGKYGTYFRYRKISMYDNDSRIEHRIRYFYKNYEFTDESLANEISKIFNVTIPHAMKHILAYREKYPHIKRSRKTLKKIEHAPKYKPPGIEISIQGRKRDKYKVRVTGARNQEMLERIIEFYKVMIYLYIDTFILKRKDRQSLIEKLKKLKYIAKRRNKVIEIMRDNDGIVKNIKKMGVLDKGRFAFKPDQNQNQYSRSCQVSGEMNRRPTGYIDVEELLRDGFVLNEKTKQYELHTTIKTGKKITKHVLTAVMLKDSEDKPIYYTCTPKVNNEYIFVDFLSKSHNPSDKCMPCCYKKNPLLSANKKRVNYYKKCVGYDIVAVSAATQDILYILQDTDKLPPHRLGLLPETLDVFFNRQHRYHYALKNHNLHNTSVYYFKYGIQQNNFPFMSLIANAFNKKLESIQDTIRQALLGKGTTKHRKSVIFSCLQEGKIKTQFQTAESYVEYIERHSSDHEYLYDILTLPGVVDPKGINVIVLRKLPQNKKQTDDYVAECLQPIDACLTDPKTVIIIKNGPYYHAVYKVVKTNSSSRAIELSKYFTSSSSALADIRKYFDFNCHQTSIVKSNTARAMDCKLKELSQKYHPISQVHDVVNKCIYLHLNCGVYIPVEPSGGIVTLSINNSIAPTIDYYNTITHLHAMSDTTSVYPIGILYDITTKKSTSSITIIGVITETSNDPQHSNTVALVPVKQETTSREELQTKAKELSKSRKLFITNKSIYKYQYIDDEIINKPKDVYIDRRILQVNEKAYLNESYQMFRLECSDLLSIHDRYKHYIRKINNDPKLADKKYLLRKILYKALNAKLYEKYTQFYKDTGNIKLNNLNSFHIISNQEYASLDFSNYLLKNIRTVCRKYPNKASCTASLHCKYVNGKCKFSITQSMFIEFVNRLTEEIMQKGIMYYEIMKESIYRVSDVINTNVYTSRPNQLILETTNDKTQKLSEIYGDAAPIIGKRRIRKILIDNIDTEYVSKGTYALQRIVDGDNTIFRTVANCMYWLNNTMYHPSDRNIGYVSTVQTDFSNFLKKQFIEYISLKSLSTLFAAINTIYAINKEKFKIVLKNKIHTTTDNQYHLVELFVINVLYSIPVVVCFDVEKIEFVIDKDDSNTSVIYTKRNYPPRFNTVEIRQKCINVKLEFKHNHDTPMHLYAMLF